MYKIRTLLDKAEKSLQLGGIENSRCESEVLLAHLMGSNRLDLYLSQELVSETVYKRLMEQVDSRVKGTPVQYLLGESSFLNKQLAVEPGVFIPRPETEVVVEAALKMLKKAGLASSKDLVVLDLGTGSGCIALSMALNLPTCHVVGVELSYNALKVAQTNVQCQGLRSRVSLIQGNWFEAIRGSIGVIVSNPPYIPTAVVDKLPLDVRAEPRLSLDGGQDGMKDLLQLINGAPNVLAKGGVFVLECLEDQVSFLLEKASNLKRVNLEINWLIDSHPEWQYQY